MPSSIGRDTSLPSTARCFRKHDAQLGFAVLRGTATGAATAATFNLNTDGTGIDSTANCYNMNNLRTQTNNLRVSVAVSDKTAVGHYVYSQPALMESWDATNGEIITVLGTAQAVGTGSLNALTSSAVTISNDSGNRCLKVQFTIPAALLDTLDVVARIDGAESQ